MANKNSTIRKANTVVKPDGAGVVSQNPRRNMRQRIYVNVDNHGVKSSVTCHEPIDPKRFNVPKNHGYMVGAYKQTVQTSSRPAVV